MDEKDEARWKYKPGGATATAERPAPGPAPQAPPSQPPAEGGTVSWTASEFIEHDRDFSWYIILAAGAVLLAGVIFAVTRDYIATATVLILAVLVGLFARHKPRQIEYELNETGVKVGDKQYAYSIFKSYSIVHDEGLSSINLEPLKRFMPPISIYFAPQDEELIISVLGGYLPKQDKEPDRIDRFARRLKF